MTGAESQSGRRHLAASRVLTCSGAGAIDDGVVAVSGDRIEAVGRRSDFGAGLTSELVEDFGDATILPGLIDAHAHVTLAADGRTYAELNEEPDSGLAAIAVMNIRRHLAAGVTTIRDNGGRNRVTFDVRSALQGRDPNSPRLLLAGRPITGRAGHLNWCNGVADGPDEVRALVLTLIAEGADHIKLVASGGGTVGTRPEMASYSVAELRSAVEAAHDNGRLTTAHCRARQSIVNALEAGVDCIEHATFLAPRGEREERSVSGTSGDAVDEYDRRVVERILSSGTYIGFTFAGGYGPLRRLREKAKAAALSPMEEADLTWLGAYIDQKLQLFSALLRDGARAQIVTSSDAGPGETEFGMMHYNAELAVQAGLSPGHAIEAMTSTAARAVGLAERVGSLMPGKVADLLVVRGNALDDIGRLSDVLAVYARGRLVATRPTVDSHASTRP